MILVFPVSAVMRFWHFVFASVFNMEAGTAWVWSIVGLILTVRLLLVPLNWTMKLSNRRSLLMNPEVAALEAELGSSTDPDDVRALQERKQKIREKYNYSLAAGCIPPLIQLLVLLGLYRLLLWLGRPDQIPTEDGSVGVLTADMVQEFQQATVFGIPVPAYVSMPEEQLVALGTTTDEVRAVMLPLLFAALVFSTLNMIFAAVWNYVTMDWSRRLQRRMLWVMVSFIVITPLLLGVAGYFGPVPAALVMYWAFNSFWTLAQNLIMTWLSARRYPEQDHHKQKRAQGKAAFRASREEDRARKRELRRRRREIMTSRPDQARALRAQLQAELRQEKEAAAEEKARLKAIAQEQARIRREIQKEK